MSDGAGIPAVEHRLSVARTARYAVAGELSSDVRELWFVLHGYGQLATYFVKHFEPLASRTRVIVAPEALSRFYVEPADTPVATRHNRVGATWMTKEAREDEIADYLAYLDALYTHVMASCDGAPVRVTILGFSQGGATASRWVTRGAVRPDRLILWASELPLDLDLATYAPRLQAMRLVSVVGDRDEFVSEEMIAAYGARLVDARIPYRLVRYAGTHRVHRETLAALAARDD